MFKMFKFSKKKDRFNIKYGVDHPMKLEIKLN